MVTMTTNKRLAVLGKRLPVRRVECLRPKSKGRRKQRKLSIKRSATSERYTFSKQRVVQVERRQKTI